MAAAKHRAMTGEEHGKHAAPGTYDIDDMAVSSSARHSALTATNLSRANSVQHYTTKRRTRARHTILRSVFVAVLALFVMGAGVAWAYVNSLNKKLADGVDQQLLDVLSEQQTEPGDPFYMLLLGVDKDEERMESDGEEYWNFRADTIILARIDPKDVKVTLVSIPRDTAVYLDEYGQSKINGAYSVGGASYMVEVVQEFAGVPISHYAEVDFDAFIAIVDNVGGIDVTLPVSISDPEYTGLELEAGTHHLDGWDALMLARSRHAYDDYGGGDFYRAANQRMVISAVARKVLASDPVTMANTISKLADYVTTDMNATDIIRLAMQMRTLDIDKNFYSGQEPTISTFMDELWYEICDTEAWQRMMQRVDAGLPPYADKDDDFTAGIAGSISQNPYDEEEEADATDELSGIDPVYEGVVIVLNAAGVDGLATETANQLMYAGFESYADTADSINGRTVIVYNGDGNKAKAKGVSEVLGGGYDVEANDGSYSEDADVVVILGTDVRY